MALFKPVSINSLVELEQWGREHDPLNPSAQWLFRGQAGADSLSTTFDRVCETYAIDGTRRAELEKKLIREFARKAHLYLAAEQLPEPDDTLEWLSIMQHHGAPTRLLDWTYSLMVAAHFATLGKAHEVEHAAGTKKQLRYIFALNASWINERANRLRYGLAKGSKKDVDKGGTNFDKHFMSNARRFVSTANPYRITKRLALQKGVFLCPGDARETFELNMAALGDGLNDNSWRLELTKGCWDEIRDACYRLNVDDEVLFPGVDGLAKALWTRAKHLDKLVPDGRADRTRWGRAPNRSPNEKEKRKQKW